MKNLPKLVIFDMDGLIFDTERLFMEKKNTVLKEYGYPARRKDYVQTLGLSGQQLHDKLIQIYGPGYPAEEISKKARAAVNTYLEKHGPDVKPGIKDLLQWLADKGVNCCVASSTRHIYIGQYLRMAGLDQYFSFVIGGEEVTRSKPEPDIFLAACERAGIKPEEALVLEDSENGVRAAAAGGIPVICIPDLKQPSPEIAGRAAAVLPSAAEVKAFLFKYSSSD